MLKKYFMVFLVVIMALVSACSNDTSAPEEKDEEKAPNEGTENSTLVSKDPMEMTIHLHYNNGNVVFDDNWKTFEVAAEKTNVSLKGVAPKSSTDSAEAFNLMVASGEIPDLVQGSKVNLNKYGKEGAFLPLQDLIKEHAPNIQKYLDEMPEITKISNASDGNLYHIPFIADGEAAEGWFVRQDWLDKLELEVPQTTEELYTVLKAFREQDPNGNGKKDEIPYFTRINYRVADLATLWGGFGSFYIKDGKVAFGPYEKEFSDAMENIAKWYSEGLIDPEIFTRGNNARDELLGNDIGGATHDWFGSTANYNNTLKSQIPDFNFVPMAPPENTKGNRVEPTIRSPFGNLSGVAIGYSNEDPVAAIKYLDFFFTEEGRRLMNYGVEGETYTLEGGKPVFTEEVLSSSDIPGKLREIGAQVIFPYHQDFEYEKQWMNPIAVQGAEDYIKNDYFMDHYPFVTMTDEEEKLYNDLQPQIMTYINETMQKWILGAEDVDYENFKSRLDQMGVKDLIKIHEDAYERYLND
ncbi:extracellular solute-binding protein [Bacillus tianshenii]|uniref:extracellular solute-binding protein n=1 Tax=Sutcliffiella tianshenii TaxID=1463404 RepID=UPI001CD1D4BB|nr:extracellular solute-binding protein [Bacillus tianshenii]MCA1321662.1 extracellular solute-binding protein [Bacillus tianshenii]